jgi:hypothetical protein
MTPIGILHSPARGLYELQEQIWARRASHPQGSGRRLCHMHIMYCDGGRELNLNSIACLLNIQRSVVLKD